MLRLRRRSPPWLRLRKRAELRPGLHPSQDRLLEGIRKLWTRAMRRRSSCRAGRHASKRRHPWSPSDSPSALRTLDLKHYSTRLLLPKVHGKQSRLGHLFDRVLEAFPAKPGIFDPAVRHVVDAECGDVAHDQSAHLKFIIGTEDETRIVGEQPGLQSVRRSVDALERVGEIFVRFDRLHRSENFVTIDLHISASVCQDSGLED